MNQRWRYLKWQREKASRRLISLLYSRLYRNPNRDMSRSILIAGAARSGTTWLADILSTALRGRIMFEPFNSRLVQGYNQFHYFQYMRPGEPNEALETFCRRVLTGTIRHPWIDRQVTYLNAEYRVIKAVRANLLLKWLHERFPETPLLFIVRHPCAVVLSRMELTWDTDKDIEPFVAQPKLVEDFLGEKMDVIMKAASPEEKHAVIWCVSQLIPLRQFRECELRVIFYEHLCMRPDTEISRILHAMQFGPNESLFDVVEKPSMTARATSAIVAGEDRLSRWKNKLRPEQINRVLGIVEAFGLDGLYGESLTPTGNNAVQ